jgi:uncharacterized protein GlcG (DUF336 family)
MNTRLALVVASSMLGAGGAAAAPDLVPTKLISMELARDIAQKAVEACRAKGYQVAAVVVDRSGFPQVVLRDVYATRFNVEISTRKANAAILAGGASSELLAGRGDIRPELNHVDGLLVMGGGLPIRAGGALLGAIGVSGAPDGDLDEACSQKALDAVADRLEFSE